MSNTPSLDAIRDVWVMSGAPFTSPRQRLAEFNHAIAQVRADAKREALMEAAYVWGEGTWQDVWAADEVECDVTAVQSTVKWLRARAARHER